MMKDAETLHYRPFAQRLMNGPSAPGSTPPPPMPERRDPAPMTTTQPKTGGDVEGAALLVSEAAARIEAAIASLAEREHPAPAATVAEPMKVAFRIVELYTEGVLGAEEAMRVVARELGFALPRSRSQEKRIAVQRATDAMPETPAPMGASAPPKNALRRLPDPEPEEEEAETEINASSPLLANGLEERATPRVLAPTARPRRSAMSKMRSRGKGIKVAGDPWTIDDYQQARLKAQLTWKDIALKVGQPYHKVIDIARGKGVAPEVRAAVRKLLGGK